MKRLLPYAQLVRLPNVFTAWADIALGWLAALALLDAPPAWPRMALLLIASSCLYCGGMVWNDFFDVEQDRRERAFRPIPSGRVSRRSAGTLGAVLLAAGVVAAALAGIQSPGYERSPLVLSVLLVASIFLYDGWLKRTWAGPGGMGACRFLNVLLGLSVIPAEGLPWRIRVHLALVVGIYIIGVTWFARTEARWSRQASLLSATVVMLGGLALALALPLWLPTPAGDSPWGPRAGALLFPYLLVAFGFLIGVPASHAVENPSPKNVQATVKRAVLGLVLLDAILATAVAGPAGLAIAALLPPALYLGRWVYST